MSGPRQRREPPGRLLSPSDSPVGGAGAARRLLVATVVAAVVVVVDQLTKSWAVHRLSHGDIHVVWKLDLALTYNSGASFGLARGWAPVIGGIAVAAVVVLLSTVRRVTSVGLTIALGLVVGGALGNLTDRVFGNHHGAVVDFIALHFWPTFNVADSCVVIGAVAAALIVSLRHPAAPHDNGHEGAVAPDVPPDARETSAITDHSPEGAVNDSVGRP